MRRSILLSLLLLLLLTSIVPADEVSRVFPAGERPDDRRLGPLTDLNGYFPFEPPQNAEEWEVEKERILDRMRVSNGLLPLPRRGPLNAVVHGRIDQGDYTVEKVYFESMPGFYVTGNLYRPTEAPGRRPVVLSPHGHWQNGRFYSVTQQQVRQDIVRGAERFEEGGRSPLQARCVQLARMGCVVFHYDMIGYADNTQLSYALTHRFATQRPEMNSRDNWGLFSPQAESHLQSVMGLQTYNSIRAIDFVCQLEDVDPERIAVTGASGGGTQTFMVSALDPRVKVSVPAVMVSTAMQGGCTCENACLLRVGRGNIDFAATFVPRPQSILAADDWTVEMPTKGFPQLAALYELLNAKDRVELNAFLHFPHNYNHVSRSAMYLWMNRYLKLGHAEPILEGDYSRLTPEELTVWDAAHPQPEGGPEFERGLLRWWTEDIQSQIVEARPTNQASLETYRELIGTGVGVVIGRQRPAAEDVTWEPVSDATVSGFRVDKGTLNLPRYGEQIPTVVVRPREPESSVVIWLTATGKSGLFADGQLRDEIQRLVERGHTVVGLDLFQQGEFLAPGERFTKTRRVENPREAAAYTFGYNPTVCARRVHDVLSAIAWAQTQLPPEGRLTLVGWEGAGHWAAAARSQAGGAVDRAVIHTGGFRFGSVDDIHSPDFLPGGARFEDLPGMLALAAPQATWIAGENDATLAPVHACYDAAKANESLLTGNDQQAALQWLQD